MLLCIFICSAYAQNDRFGVSWGLNYSNIYGESEFFDFSEGKTKFKPSFFVGCLYEFQISDKFLVRPELTYSRKGFRNEWDDWTFYFNYLDLTALFRYELMPKTYVEAGLSGGYLLNSNMRSFTYNKFDFLLAGGFSYNIKQWLGVGIRYNQGLIPFIKEYNYQIILPGDPVIIDYNEKIRKKHRVIQLGLTFKPFAYINN